MTRPRMVFWTAISLAVCVALAVLLSALLGPLELPEGFTRADQCERLRPASTVMEPQNAWSNIAYAVAGLLIFFRNLGSGRLLALLFGASLVGLAWFSGLYHAQPASDVLRKLDVATIYWVLPLLVAYAVHGVFAYKVSGAGWAPAQKIGVAVFIVASGTALAFLGGMDSTIATLVLVAILIGLTGWTMFGKTLPDPLWDIEKAVYSTGLLLLLVASGVTRLFDGRGEFLGLEKFLCSPDAIVQAHALWHVFSAATLLVGYNFLSRAFGDDGTVFPD